MSYLFIKRSKSQHQPKLKGIIDMAKKSFPLSKVYSLLESGPVVMVTTARGGHQNIMTTSWHMMIEFEPPLVGCIISNRNHSFDLLQTTNEYVINIPRVKIAEKVVGGRQDDQVKIKNEVVRKTKRKGGV
jgi:hypothetical protein